MRTNILLSLSLAAAAAVGFSSCNPEAAAVSGREVVIDINPMAVSAGFASVHFAPNKEAYYLVGIVPADEAPDTSSSAAVRTFMNLKLDAAYTDYINWRHSLLVEQVPFVAEFPTHSLQYGEIDHNFTYLFYDTDYWIYAFVVNPVTNRPDGRLFFKRIHTTEDSQYLDTRFEYRVRGLWEYIYPVDSASGSIRPDVPWARIAVDSLELVKLLDETGDESLTVAGYFDVMFVLRRAQFAHAVTQYGIYARNTAAETSDTTAINYEIGHTYYMGIALFDSYFDFENGAKDIYKFRWNGEANDYFFKDSMSLKTPR